MFSSPPRSRSERAIRKTQHYQPTMGKPRVFSSAMEVANYAIGDLCDANGLDPADVISIITAMAKGAGASPKSVAEQVRGVDCVADVL